MLLWLLFFCLVEKYSVMIFYYTPRVENQPVHKRGANNKKQEDDSEKK